MEVYAIIDQRTKPSQVGALAERAEAQGFDGLAVADGIHDGLLLAGMALRATTRLKVAIAVLVAFPRSPMTVAQAAWDLQELSGGRFELGLGPQVRANIEDRYSTSWAAPAPRMREYLNSLRELFHCFQTMSTPNFEGEHYHFRRLQPFFNPGPIEHPEIPLYMGAVGPKMTAVAGEVADGLVSHPTNTHPRYVREVTQPRLCEAASRVGRDASEVKLFLAPLVATGRTSEEVLADREKQRKLLAFVYSTPAYWPCLELFGWRERGEALREFTRQGKWKEMPSLITDEMLEELLPCAPYAEIADQLRERYDGLASAITFPLPEDPALDAEVGKVVARLHD